MTENPPKTVQVSEEELATLRKQASDSKATADKAEKELEALRKKREHRRINPIAPSPLRTEEEAVHDPKTERGSENKGIAVENQNPSLPHSHAEGQPHYIGAWQRFCPTCGDQNPDFKDETKCDGCGTHLGALDVAKKLKACPNCGGKSASKL